MIEVAPEGFIQFSSEGMFHTVPPAGLMVTSGLVTPELRSVKWLMDKKMQDRVAPMLQSMHAYICLHRNDYGFGIYYMRECACDQDIRNKRTDILLNLYEDDENTCGCEPGWGQR